LDNDLDVGFSALAPTQDDGIVFAHAGALGSLWRIELSSAKATKIDLPLLFGCRYSSASKR